MPRGCLELEILAEDRQSGSSRTQIRVITYLTHNARGGSLGMA
jgi:hypothetical protein